jgi:hypothetical protein
MFAQRRLFIPRDEREYFGTFRLQLQKVIHVELNAEWLFVGIAYVIGSPMNFRP